MRILFMGTPYFAVPSLRALLQSPWQVVAVVTAPDKPAGRGLQVTQSEVKKFALQHQLPVLQPTNLKSDSFYEELKKYSPDVIVVVAFRMLPERVWSFPRLGTINVHASLLPDYRGPAPIPWVILNGETQTGVTTFFIEKEIDTGKLLLQRSIPIPLDWNAGDLHDALMELGAELLIETLQKIENQSIQPIPQDPTLYKHHAPKLTTENTQIQWNQSDRALYNFIRGLAPAPGAWTTFQGKKLKIYKASLVPKRCEYAPGTLFVENKNLYVACENNACLAIQELQLEGKSKMQAIDFVNGYCKHQTLYTL